MKKYGTRGMSKQKSRSPKEIVKEEINRLKEAGIYAGFDRGKRMPDFELPNQDGELISP